LAGCGQGRRASRFPSRPPQAAYKIFVTPNQGEGIRPRASAMETKMRHLMLKTCVAGACALGFVAAGGAAYAVSPYALDQGPSLLIQVEDMETEAVDEDLRPDEMPDGMEEGKDDMEAMPEESDDGGNMEDEMIDEIGPGAE
jgi:hypothetical protein